MGSRVPEGFGTGPDPEGAGKKKGGRKGKGALKIALILCGGLALLGGGIALRNCWNSQSIAPKPSRIVTHCRPKVPRQWLVDEGDQENDQRARVDELTWQCEAELAPGGYDVKLENEVIFCGRDAYRSDDDPNGYLCGSATDSAKRTVSAHVAFEILQGAHKDATGGHGECTNPEDLDTRHIPLNIGELSCSTVGIQVDTATSELSLKMTCKRDQDQRICLVDFAPARMLRLKVTRQIQVGEGETK